VNVKRKIILGQYKDLLIIVRRLLTNALHREVFQNIMEENQMVLHLHHIVFVQ